MLTIWNLIMCKQLSRRGRRSYDFRLSFATKAAPTLNCFN